MSSVFTASQGTRLRLVAAGMHELRLLFEEVAPQYSPVAEITIIDKGYSQAVSDIQAMRQDQGVDIVVSAGTNGSFLRQHLDIPVVMVKAGGLDIMRGLARASRGSRRIGLVAYGAVPPELRHFNDLFGLGVALRAYSAEEEAEGCVRELLALGVESIIGHGLVTDLARSYGIEGILLYSQGAVREAIEDAVEVARISRLESARREKLNTILGRLKDGVVAVDLDERIEIINPAMAAVLGRPADQLVGQRLGMVNSVLSLQDTLRTGQTEAELVRQVGGKTVVLTRMPVLEQGRHTGAVLVCQDPVAIQRMDRSLRSRGKPRSNAARYGLEQLVGRSPAIGRVRQRALTCARSDATVLIIGESGTGKELLAQGIHNASARRAQPFVAVNCAAFPDSLLESELFGYVDGAFTGSSRGGKVGLFEAAHTGTLFLDEIGEMPLPLQTRLLRVLQEREVLRIGATQPTPVDVRIIAATHQDLAERARSGHFRSDLYYRLNILLLTLPPLRERLSDLPLLVSHLHEKIARRLGVSNSVESTLGEAGHAAGGGREVVQAIVEAARGYAWPGNIRELENLIERVMVFCESAPAGGDAAIELRSIAPELFMAAGGAQRPVPGNRQAALAVAGVLTKGAATALNEKGAPEEPSGEKVFYADRLLKDTAALTPQAVLEALKACDGNRAAAAAALGISRTTLWRRLKRMEAGARNYRLPNTF